MDLKVCFFVVLVLVQSVIGEQFLNSTIRSQCPNVKTSLVSVRKRRHLAFPTGSAVSIVTQAVKAIMTHVPSGWNVVLEAELVYRLPEAEVQIASFRKKLHHRQKKEIWETLQNAFDQRNMNGQACIMRTVCEAQHRLAPKGKSLVHDILRAMFTAPVHEHEFVEEMGATYQELLEVDFCTKPYDCPFSVLEFLLDFNKQR